jgi:polyisoprenoid-binding protein YceI
MRNTIASVLTAFLIVPSVFGTTWEIDPSHSHVGFIVKHLVITKVNGAFKDFSGKIEYDGKDFSKGSVEVNIDPKSISTDNVRRDNDLRSPSFFAVDSFPEMGFKSTKINAVNGDSFKVVGNLTMRGKTKEVTLNATFNGTAKMGPSLRASFSATGRINRQDWGISWSKTLDSGGLVVANDVDMVLEVEAVQTAPGGEGK